MNSPSSQTVSDEALVVDNWPMSLAATRDQLHKAQLRLDRYRAALRLAGVEIERRNRGIIALTTFAYQGSRTASPAVLLKLAMVQALETTNATSGAIILIEPSTKELILSIHKGLTSELNQILIGQQLGQGATALMPHLVAGNGALLEYKTTEDKDEQLLLAAGNLTSLVSLPLQLGSRVIGAMLVGLQGDRSFSPTDLCFLMALGQETAVALDSLHLREGLWCTAEVLLGGEITNLDLPLNDNDLNVKFSMPFDLLATPSTAPEPASDDLEQLLAAMMDAEDEVQQQNADLQTLNTIAEMMNRTLKLKEILACAVEQTQAILQTDAAWLYLLDEDDQLGLRAHTGLSAAYVRGMQRLSLGEGIEGRAALENKPFFVESIIQDSYAYKIWVDKEAFQSLAAVPLTRPDPESQTGPGESHVLGVLASGRRGERPWTPREIRLLASIANQIALAVDNARLYAQVQEEGVRLRGGNLILNELNDMLLKKNVYLEGFIEEDLTSALTTASLTLNHLLLQAADGLTETQKEDILNLQKVVRRVAATAKNCLMSSK